MFITHTIKKYLLLNILIHSILISMQSDLPIKYNVSIQKMCEDNITRYQLMVCENGHLAPRLWTSFLSPIVSYVWDRNDKNQDVLILILENNKKKVHNYLKNLTLKKKQILKN